MLTEKEVWCLAVHANWDRWVDCFEERDAMNDTFAQILQVDVEEIFKAVNRARDAASSSRTNDAETPVKGDE